MSNETLGTIQRYQIADYLRINEKWVFCGLGFNTLDENPAAQLDTKTYISDRAATSTIKSYQTVFPFDTDLIASEEAIMTLYDIGRNQKTGTAAELEYCRVELFKPVAGQDNVFEGRIMKVATEVSGLAGGGGETIHVTGSFHNVGSFKPIIFDTVNLEEASDDSPQIEAAPDSLME